jgi:excisionase family DNA binding protein
MQSMLTVTQAAEMTNSCEETVRRWCRTGKIKYKKFGRRLLIYSSEFQTETTEQEKIINFVFG